MKPVRELTNLELYQLETRCNIEATLRLTRGEKEDKLFADLYKTIADLSHELVDKRERLNHGG